jgi:hypothetical protein
MAHMLEIEGFLGYAQLSVLVDFAPPEKTA